MWQMFCPEILLVQARRVQLYENWKRKVQQHVLQIKVQRELRLPAIDLDLLGLVPVELDEVAQLSLLVATLADLTSNPSGSQTCRVCQQQKLTIAIIAKHYLNTWMKTKPNSKQMLHSQNTLKILLQILLKKWFSLHEKPTSLIFFPNVVWLSCQ